MNMKSVLISLLIVLLGASGGLLYYYKPNLFKELLQDAPFEGNINNPELDELDTNPTEQDEYALSEGQKQRRLRELNKRLSQEDQSRAKMDALLAGIAQDEALLRNKLAEAQRRLDALRKRKANGDAVEDAIEKAMAAVQSHRNALDEIGLRRDQLMHSRELALQSQISLEEEILNSGGSIMIYDYEVWSPNYKRSDILHFQDIRQDYMDVEDKF